MKPRDERIPDDLASSGWHIAVTSRDLFYLHRPGIRTANSVRLETAIEAARRIDEGQLGGIKPALKRPRRTTTPGEIMKVGNCQKCQAEVVMVRHKRTRNLAPIEVQPSDDGNILITGDEYEIVPKDEREKVRRRGFVLRKNHFATCAFAKSFAKGKAAA